LTYFSCFLVLSYIKLRNLSVKIFQSFAFNITKNISWLTSQYVLKLYINSCAIFKEQFLEKHGFSKLNRLVKPVSSEYEVNILLLHFSIERR